MSMHTIIREGRKSFVKLPLSEYEVLLAELEDLRDTVVFDRASEAGDKGFPSGVMRQLIEGENPVRVLRKWREMTQAELARQAGCSQGYITQLESGKRKGSLSSLRKIASALDIDLDDITDWF